ncbi:MAG: transposase [Pyrinomonadaceae bacterium]|nr:transposase [Pyrinomonadaceae bacterium]
MKISRDNPFYFITFVTNDRLNVFQKRELKNLISMSFDEARKSADFSIFAYVIMPDHVHLITSSEYKSSVVLRYLKGISARRIIDFLKKKNFQTSLDKLGHKTLKGNWNYSLWQHRSNVLSLISENILMEKVNYIHQNPVKENLVKTAGDYRWSSARFWNGNPADDEPLEVDAQKIHRRKA